MAHISIGQPNPKYVALQVITDIIQLLRRIDTIWVGTRSLAEVLRITEPAPKADVDHYAPDAITLKVQLNR